MAFNKKKKKKAIMTLKALVNGRQTQTL